MIAFLISFNAVPELSPKNHLVHVHGIFRNNSWDGSQAYIVDQEILSNLWEEIHGAKITWIARPVAWKDAIEYMTKHTVKEYPETSKLGFRIMTSKGWLPDNMELVRRLIVKGVTYERAHIPGFEEKNIWMKVEKNIERWLVGENTLLTRFQEGETVYIKGNEVITLEKAETYDLTEYALMIGLLKIEDLKENKQMLKAS